MDLQSKICTLENLCFVDHIYMFLCRVRVGTTIRPTNRVTMTKVITRALITTRQLMVNIMKEHRVRLVFLSTIIMISELIIVLRMQSGDDFD